MRPCDDESLFSRLVQGFDAASESVFSEASGAVADMVETVVETGAPVDDAAAVSFVSVGVGKGRER